MPQFKHPSSGVLMLLHSIWKQDQLAPATWPSTADHRRRCTGTTDCDSNCVETALPSSSRPSVRGQGLTSRCEAQWAQKKGPLLFEAIIQNSVKILLSQRLKPFCDGMSFSGKADQNPQPVQASTRPE